MTDPAHSKSEYKRRATLGDPDVTPPADLPPLPEPAINSAHPLSNGFAYGYHADQMRAYALTAVAAERERCAALCMAKSAEFIARGTSPLWEGCAHGAERCAEAIREG